MRAPRSSLPPVVWLPLCLLSGALLGLAGPPLFAPWLTLVGLIPFLVVLLHPGTGWVRGALAAGCVGVAQDVVLATILEFPVPMALAMGLGFALLWAVAGGAAAAVLRRLPPGAGPFVAAAAFTGSEYLATLIPGFGATQCFARALVAWPWTVQVASLAGIVGVVFVVVLAQGLVALPIARLGELRRGELRRCWPALTAAAAVVLVAVVFSVSRMSPPTTATVRVGAVGWTYDEVGATWEEPGGTPEYLRRVLAPMVREAAGGGADLVVAPEVALRLDAGEVEPTLDALGALARETRATLVVGYFDRAGNDNHAVVIGPDGAVHGDYVKTHLIPGFEDYTAGDGDLVTVDSPAARLGVMICQDDNFPDLARGYGRERVALLAVPTNDWEQVQEFHLQGTRVRAVDSGFAVVRGATHGISAIVDARGRVLARRDHHAEGAGPLVADLPLVRPGTPYAHAGAWLPVVCVLFLAGGAILGRREGRRG